MKLRNQVQLIGRLGATPEIKETANGKKLTKFSIATNESYTDTNGNKVEDTQWHNLIAWGKKAELICQLTKKGQEVAFEGKLTHRKYEDKDGATKYITEVVVNDFLLLGKKSV